MQITTMPTSTIFKTKWNTFITKLSPIHHHHTEHSNKQQTRRRSSSEDIHNKRRKHSDAMSVGTFESTISMADKFRQAIPFFRRRSSSNLSSAVEDNNNNNNHITTVTSATAATINSTHTSTTHINHIVIHDVCEELEKLKSLYNLAVEELKYAEDSQGSSYYSGDLVTAREALDDCANAFMLILTRTNDLLTREGLQSSMAPKLLKLQKRIDALPEVNDTY